MLSVAYVSFQFIPAPPSKAGLIILISQTKGIDAE